jgi:hypothetical protein
VEPDVAVTAAVTAALASPAVCKVVRRGLVYGLAGLLIVRDKVAQAASGVAEGARRAASAATSETTTAPAPSWPLAEVAHT